MRWKIIIANAAIVVIVGLLSFALLRTGLGDVLANRSERRVEAQRAVSAANTHLSLEQLRLERWLATHASSEEARSVFEAGTSQARSETASAQARRIKELLSKAPSVTSTVVSLVLFVDDRGIAIGRNDSNQMRGDDLGRSYPSLLEALKGRTTASDVWLSRSRAEQLLVSYAPVVSDTGALMGAVIVGSPLNDERLSRLSSVTSGRALAVGAVGQDGDTVEIVAEGTRSGSGPAFAAMRQQAVLHEGTEALRVGHVVFHHDEMVFSAEPLRLAGGGNVFLMAGMERSLVPSVSGLLWPIFTVSLLGILLVVVAGTFLGNYIANPISELEEGLLSIINGRTNLRFELEHPDLGGLVSRINSLLNALMGVPETDSEGRTSTPPGARYREAEGP